MKIYEQLQNSIVPVELGERSYPIYIGDNILNSLGETLAFHLGRKKAVLITDSNVGTLYAQRAKDSLDDAGIKAGVIEVKPGEVSKGKDTLFSIYDELFDLGIERSDTIIALGGGVIGDLAGYAAASFKRGTNFVQVPTSLLAMVDSSVGGKTGINHPRGKNMIGAFYQPAFVMADVAALKTLPARELACGLAESVKHGVIQNLSFFEWMEENYQNILNCKPETMTKLVAENVKVKASVVSQDEREGNLRQILNYGHTYGHAVEVLFKVNGENQYHHGEAVAIGIAHANQLAVDRGLLTEEQSQRISQLLTRFNLPLKADFENHPEISQAQIEEAIKHDKKVRDGKVVYILPESIGKCQIVAM